MPFTVELTVKQASDLAALPLRSLYHEYPNHIMHLLNGAEDVRSPRDMHPVFYGCYDWHSAVHGYWLLARCARLYPSLPQQDAITTLFDEHFTVENMQKECAYFQAPGRTSFERPYGFAWVMALAQELDIWQHPKAKTWLAAMEPLTVEIRSRILSYFTKLSYPIRVGTHYNSAFALKLILDFARHRSDTELEALVVSASRRYYAEDTNYPANYEPGGDEFLSAALTEALLMSDVLPASEFAGWFAQYLPVPGHIDRLLAPAHVSDHSDPKIAHLNGLNLSRAWCMKRIAGRLPESAPAKAVLDQAAKLHIEAGLPHVISGEYAGEHWLATFAMLALEPVH